MSLSRPRTGLRPFETPPPGLVGEPPGKCPLSRVAMVRGSDSEASEGGDSMRRGRTAFTEPWI